MDHARGVGDLDDHQQQVLPHPPDLHLPPLVGPFREGDLQILPHHSFADFHPLGEQACQRLRQPLAGAAGQTLHHTDSHAHGDVGETVGKPGGEGAMHRFRIQPQER